jgi:hypothetical protein
MMVLVFWFCNMSTNEMCHSLLSLSCHPHRMASFVTVIMVSLALYTLMVSLLNTVI